MNVPPPCSEAELLARAEALTGARLDAVAARLGCPVPVEARRAKGWAGAIVERALGADAGARPVPDFVALGIELKTVPMDKAGQPRESTFVCMVPMQATVGNWAESPVRRKLARVLWIPVEGGPRRLGERRIGAPRLWSPSAEEDRILREDWLELTELVALGRLGDIDARLGTWLQIRPKALDSRQLTAARDEDGHRQSTLPRGFYLRTRFTRGLFASTSWKTAAFAAERCPA